MAIIASDIQLLFGVSGEGSISGESGKLIQSQLNEIIASINSNPLKVKVALDQSKSSLSSDITKQFNAFKNKPLSVSKVDISKNALSSFKSQLQAMINTINLDKNISVTLASKDIGNISGEIAKVGLSAEDATKQVALFESQLSTLSSAQNNIQTSLNSLAGSSSSEAEIKALTDLQDRSAQFFAGINTLKASNTAASESNYQSMLKEAGVLSDMINLTQANTTASKNANTEKEAAKQKTADYTTQAAQLEASLKKVSTALTTLKKNSTNEEEIAKLNELQKAYDSLNAKIKILKASKTAASEETYQGLLKETSGLNTSVEAINKNKAASKEYDNTLKTLETTLAAIAKQITTWDTTGVSASQAEGVNKVKAAYSGMKAELDGVNTAKNTQAITDVANSTKELSGIQERAIATQALTANINNTNKALIAGQTAAAQLNVLYKQISTYSSKNTKLWGTTTGNDIEALKTQVYSLLTTTTDWSKVDVSRLRASFSALTLQARTLNLEGRTFSNLLASAYQRFGGWALITRTMTTVIQKFKQMITNVKELDTSMTELKKITNETSTVYNDFLTEATNRAQELGAAVTDVVSATSDFVRLGYSISDATNLADAALVYLNVGDGLENVTDASESLISTMKAFGIEAEDAMTIVDRFNSTGNNFAISAAGVGDALMNSASSLAAANNGLDESIALVTAANGVIQDPEKVGTALKTTSMYLRAATTELEDAGEGAEGVADSVSDLRDKLLALTGGKVDIQIDADTFKNTYQILEGLSVVWEDLTDITQANILEMVGGKRNSNVVSALLSNFDTAAGVLEVTADSAGSALEENEKYLDSIAGELSILTASFETLSNTYIDNEWLKDMIDFGDEAVKTTTWLVDRLDSVPMTLGLIVGGISAVTATQSPLTQLNLTWNNFRNILDKNALSANTLKAEIAEYNAVVAQGSVATAGYSSNLTKTNEAYNAYIAQLNGEKATMSGFVTYCNDAGIAVAKVTVQTKLAALQIKAMSMATSMLLTMAISKFISLAVTKIQDLVVTSEEAVEAMEDLNAAFETLKDNTSNNISTLESLSSEFKELSKGVTQYGENISLSADEYDRYQEIISDIIDLSPELAEGYSIENGYLADKNDLIERAIELQEKLYLSGLKDNTATENLKTAFDGYAVEYDEVMSEMENSKINARSTMLDLFSKFEVENAAIYPNTQALEEDMLRVMGYTESSIEEAMSDMLSKGSFNLSDFTNQYEDEILLNISKIRENIDYDSLGFDSESDYNDAMDDMISAYEKYADVRDSGLEDVNSGISYSLSQVAELNEAYRSMDSVSQSVVGAYINSISPEDVFTDTNWSGDSVSEEEVIEEIKENIDEFIESVSSGIQSTLTYTFDIKASFDANLSSGGEFLSAAENLYKQLEDAGISDSAIASIRVNLDTDRLSKQIDEIKGKISEEADRDKVGDMTLEDLSFAYKVVVSDSSDMTIDELYEAMRQLKLQSSDFIDPFDFTDLFTGLDKTVDGLDSIISAMDKLRSGTALTKQELAKLALEYPDLLKQADMFTDGSIDGQKNLLNTILNNHEVEYDALLDAEIAKLEAERQVVNEQLKIESEKANLLQGVEQDLQNNNLQSRKEYENLLLEYNDLEGQNFVTMSGGILKVNEEAVREKVDQEEIGYTDTLTLTDEFSLSLGQKIVNLGKSAGKAIKAVWDDLMSGGISSIDTYWSQFLSDLNQGVNDDLIEGSDLEKNLEAWHSIQEKATEKSIQQLKGFEAQLTNAIENLKNLKGLDLTTIYGSGSSRSSKDIEEYLADIADYREALERLSKIRLRKDDLDGILSNTEDLKEQISLQEQLIGVYEEEQKSLVKINALRDKTIANGVEALNALGFTVDYSADDNKFFVKNIELLNELVATSAGEYDSLDEATNALREDTESLIDTLEGLNQENIDDADALEELAYIIADAKNSVVETLKEIVVEASEAIDGLQDVYSTLQTAADEYSNNGHVISIDALQSIIELGPQYLQYLTDENGLLTINEEKINAVIAAKTEHLALESAMAYIDRLRLTLNGESLESLNDLLYATTETTNSTWGLVYANLALLDLSGEQYDAALYNINAIRSLAENAIKGIYGLGDATADELSGTYDSLNSILEYVMDMITQSIENQVQALEDEKDAYQDIINLKKEALELTKDENDYQENVADTIADIAKLQSKIDTLSLDDSRDAQSQKAELELEMSELQKELADLQGDYALEAQQESLDDMYDAYEKEKDDEILALEDTISSYQKLYDLALDYIEDNWDSLYGELIDWNYQYGSVLSSEITSAWDDCLAAAKRYGDFTSALEHTNDYTNNSNNSSNLGSNNTVVGNTVYDDSYSNTDAISAIVSEMKDNGKKYNVLEIDNTSGKETSGQRSLRERNSYLSTQLSGLGVEAVYDSSSGVWYIDRIGGTKLYDKYHSGGVVGDSPTLEQNEVMAILEQGEVVLDAEKQKGLYELIDFNSVLSEKLGTMIKDIDFSYLFPVKGNFSSVPFNSIANNTCSVHFGDTYITGTGNEIVNSVQNVNRKFTNEILSHLNIKK